MRKQSGHLRVGNPCVICALYEVFIDLGTARDNQGQSVSPALLRSALSKRPSERFLLVNVATDVEAINFLLFF